MLLNIGGKSCESIEEGVLRKMKTVMLLLTSEVPFPGRPPRPFLFYAVFGVKSRLPVAD